MTTALLDNERLQYLDDAGLISASRSGSREAFGQIVRKYQSMITGLLYASCGDIHRSEDLAQETFISAWKSLSGLREPGKLAAWLCQIARHRLLDQARSASREDARLNNLFEGSQPKTAPSPESDLLSQEEKDLLWHTLAKIEQPYRETLVLYYRQGKSAAHVAEAMETTEANVRQRLARGREMLREQVAAMLERNLSRSAPSPAFTLAVMAALPAAVPTSVKAATVGLAIKGASSGGLLASLAMWSGPFIGLLGGIFGTRASIRATQTPRERRFMVRTSIAAWICVLVAMAILFALNARSRHWSRQTAVMAQVGFWVVYAAVLPVLIIVMNRRHRRIRREEGLPAVMPAPAISAAHRAWGLIGATVGAVAWMFVFALQSRDWATAAIMCLVVNVLLAIAFYVLHGRPASAMPRYMLLHNTFLAILTGIVINLRLYVWIATINGTSVAEIHRRLPPMWMANLLLIVIWAGMEAMALAMISMQNRVERNVPSSQI